MLAGCAAAARAHRPCSSARCQRCATRAPAATPFSARSIAGASARSSPSLPKRCGQVGPGAHGARGWCTSAARTPRPPAPACASASGPEPLSPCSFPPCQTSEKASPPTPLSVGSQTVRQAAAASAASIALPPCSSARTPARVAAGWLVATSAPPTIVGIRGKSLRAKPAPGEQAVEVDLHAGVSTVRSLIPVAARAVPRAPAGPRARGARASPAARRRRRARGSPRGSCGGARSRPRRRPRA